MSLAVDQNFTERRRALMLRPRAVAEIIDQSALAARLEQVADEHAADQQAMRKAAAPI